MRASTRLDWLRLGGAPAEAGSSGAGASSSAVTGAAPSELETQVTQRVEAAVRSLMDSAAQGRINRYAVELMHASVRVELAQRLAAANVDVDEAMIDDTARFLAAVRARPEVIEAHRLAGDIDYILKVMVKNARAYDRFYQALISEVRIHNVTALLSMEEMKATTALPIPEA